MLAKTNTVTFLGIEVYKVEIQVHISSGGLPAFNIVGMANKSISESKERVRAAFASIGLSFPAKRITVNLSPADLLKEGVHFDLGIAVGLLVAMEIVPESEAEKFLFMGELALNGHITKVNGVLPAAISAKNMKLGIVCPQENAPEAGLSGNENIITPANLIELVNHFTGKYRLRSEKYNYKTDGDDRYDVDMSDVKGQEMAKKALEIAAAGNHNLLLVGPPGTGKSMLAKRLNTIMPQLSEKEKLDASIIASIAGTIDSKNALVQVRPFREPHSSSSMPAIVGGGKDAKPGEVTLAHLGILFLDELPEFNKQALEALRQPLEAGKITIARVNAHVTYPANFQLIAAMNPCKCGYYGNNENLMCRKAPMCAEDYQSRISGPLMDRFDMHVHVSPITTTEMGLKQNNDSDDKKYETSADILKRVIMARELQYKRCRDLGVSNITNSQLDGDLLQKVVDMDEQAKKLICAAAEKFYLSMRGVNRVLRVARTIADLNNMEKCTSATIAEALSYRFMRNLQ